jgi:hypothetical protein
MSGAVSPMAGRGFVARLGELLLVTGEGGDEVDHLLGAIGEVAGAGGDGAALVRRVSALLAADLDGAYPPCAAGGPTADGRYAVLVYGSATADLVAGGSSVNLSGVEAVTAVNRLVNGPVTTVQLQLPGAVAPDPRSRLDGGVVTAAGVVHQLANGPSPQAAAPVLPMQAVAPPAAPVVPAQPGPPPQPVIPVQPVPVPQPAPVSRPPLRQPDPGAPFDAVLLMPDAGLPDATTLEPMPPRPAEVDQRPRVRGVLCKNEHFNDPNAIYCAVCGISMAQVTLVPLERVRPPLGLMLLDDGSTFRLDADYLIGREPEGDADVVAGSVRPLRIPDGEGLISRKHLRVALVGWEVRVIDLGSANGTWVSMPSGAQRQPLAPHQPFVVRPGAQVGFGRRWLRYESNRQS